MSKTMKTIPKLRFPEFRDAPEWEEKVVGDIGRVSMCKRVMKDETSEIGDIPFYKIGTFGKKADAYISKALYEDYIKKYPYPKKGDILISASGTIGRLVVFDGLPAYFQDSNIVWIDNDEKIVKNSFLLFFYTTIKWTTEDTTIARLYNDNLKSVHILVPSIKEQQKIADSLCSVDELITAQSAKVEALKAHKKALMQQLFPAEGETTPRLRFPEFRDAPEWEEKNGNEVFEQISNKEHNSDLPILAITQEYGAIPREAIDYRVSVMDKSIESYKVVEIGDFIISLRSFQGGIEYSQYKGICSPAYIILRKKIDLESQFFKFYFKTQKFIQQLNKNLEGIRDGKMVSYKQFSELLLPIPSVVEQQKIADCLSSIDELIASQSAKVEALKQHKKALMQQLFPSTNEVNQ